MADRNGRLFDEVGQSLASATEQVERLAALHWRLAEIELRQSAQAVRRLAVVGTVGALMLLSALPLILVAACDGLDTVAPLGSVPWAWPVGLAMAATGPALAWLAWRRFRRDFRGLEQSIEELREDLVWLREWTGSQEPESPVPDGEPAGGEVRE